jgi:hypothetical protein
LAIANAASARGDFILNFQERNRREAARTVDSAAILRFLLLPASPRGFVIAGGFGLQGSRVGILLPARSVREVGHDGARMMVARHGIVARMVYSAMLRAIPSLSCFPAEYLLIRGV